MSLTAILTALFLLGAASAAATTQSSGDKGWGIDPNGRTASVAAAPDPGDRGWGIDPNGRK